MLRGRALSSPLPFSILQPAVAARSLENDIIAVIVPEASEHTTILPQGYALCPLCLLQLPDITQQTPSYTGKRADRVRFNTTRM